MKGVRVARTLIGIIMLCGMSFFLGYKMQGNNSRGSNEEESKKVKSEQVAIVNQDMGTKVGDETINYGTKLLASDLPENFEITGLEVARNGLKSGNYAAYVILPTSFSECVVSLNDTPHKAEIQFSINENLDGEMKDKVALNTMAFINGLNYDLSYMYISTILKEFHTAQDAALTVMEHDADDRDVILQIKPQDLIEMVPIPELERLENNQKYLDIQKYIAKNQELVQTVDQQYTQYISLSREDYKKLSESGKELLGEWGVMETTLENTDLTHNEEGTSLYEEGLSETSKLLKNYNLDLDKKETEIGNITEAGILNITTILQKLDQMLIDYKTLFQTGTSEEVVSGLKDLYPQISVTSGEGDTLSVNSSQIVIPYGNVTIDQMPEGDWKNQTAARIAILEKYVATMEPYRITQSQPSEPQPEPSEEGDGMENGGGGEEGEPEPAPVPDPVPEWEISPEVLQAAGYSSWDDMYQVIQCNGWSIGVQSVQIDKRIKLEELRTAIQQAIDGILDKETYDQTVDDFINGLPLFETKLMEPGGEETSVQELIEKELIKLGSNSGDELLEPIKVKDVQTTVTEKVVQPLVDKTEKVKSELIDQYGYEKTQMQSYEQLLNEFDPLKYIEQDEIQKTVGQMEGNGDTLQDEIDAYGDHGIEYADKIYTTADENIRLLGEQIEEAQKTSEDAVKNGLQKAQNVKESNSAVNQALMLELTKKLPFTRLGSLEFAKTYEFMANPLELNQKSEDTTKPEVALSEKAETDNSINLKPILLGVMILLTFLAAAEFLRKYLNRRRSWSVN